MRPAPTGFAVRLADIPPEGLEHAYDLGGAFAEQALAGTEVDAATSKLSADVSFFKTGREVLLRGHLAGDLRALCSRCAGQADVVVAEDFQVLFLPPGERDAPAGDEPSGDEPDVVHYSGEEIDIGEMLREEVLLALPIAPLCAETCRGLCPRCGFDLNQGPCDCPPEPRDDRFAALRNVKL